VTTTGTQHRKPSMGDKLSGGLMNLKGSLTGKPGVKVSYFSMLQTRGNLLTMQFRLLALAAHMAPMAKAHVACTDRRVASASYD